MHRCVVDALPQCRRLRENLTKVSADSYGSQLKAEYEIEQLIKHDTLYNTGRGFRVLSDVE